MSRCARYSDDCDCSECDLDRREADAAFGNRRLMLDPAYKNIHGHMHSGGVGDPRYVCVSAEHTGLAPILMDTVL